MFFFNNFPSLFIPAMFSEWYINIGMLLIPDICAWENKVVHYIDGEIHLTTTWQTHLWCSLVNSTNDLSLMRRINWLYLAAGKYGEYLLVSSQHVRLLLSCTGVFSPSWARPTADRVDWWTCVCVWCEPGDRGRRLAGNSQLRVLSREFIQLCVNWNIVLVLIV